ncbi:MAG: hypothetical protein HRU20_00865 [Pseudomonadales bacterium]|nr:hypothetical protein [Pseudomonadales bacterium]
MRLTKVIWRKNSRPAIAAAALVVGFIGSHAFNLVNSAQMPHVPDVSAQRKSKPVKSDGPNLKYIAAFEELKYAGYSNINGNIIYSFEHPTYGRIRSDSHVFRKMSIQPLSDCAIELSYYNKDYIISCDQTDDFEDLASISE